MDQYPCPIFILGMPRSGTSLVEQILASHSLVHGAGELNYLSQVIANVQINPHKEEKLDFASKNIEEIAEEYLSLLRKHNAEAAFISDKLPGNFPFIGFIKLLMPNAKIIHCKRDAKATIFSCFRHFFTDYMPYAFDLKELQSYYLAYKNLMEYWDILFSDEILTVDYQDMVANQEKTTRMILEYLGLDFEEQQLEFYRNSRRVETASFAQVRQAIYQGADDKWLNYDKYLGLSKIAL